MRQKTILIILVLLIFLGKFLWNKFIDNEKENIQSKPGFSEGTITRIRYRRGGYRIVHYRYSVSGKYYEESCLMENICDKAKERLKLFAFPVIYNVAKPRQSRILVTKDSFEEFGMKPPDSLKWVQDLCKQ